MTNEVKWRYIWGCWLAAGVVAEVVALNSKDKDAALSHHLRQNTHILGKTHVGRVALLAGATWLHRHLYRPMLEEARPISKIKGQPKQGENDLGKGDFRVVLHADGKRLRTELRAGLGRIARRPYDRRPR